jgi:predicted RNA-binding Zn-ribbon protein involved in translation (DUF1610 family)
MRKSGDKGFILREIAIVRTRGREGEPPQVSKCQTPVQIQVQSLYSFVCPQCGSLVILIHSILCPNCDSQRARQVEFHREKTYESKSHRRVYVPAKRFCLISGLPKTEENHFELMVSLPQHSGRSGNADRSHPPPSAWTSVTASTMRRPRILTAVTSSERAAL